MLKVSVCITISLIRTKIPFSQKSICSGLTYVLGQATKWISSFAEQFTQNEVTKMNNSLDRCCFIKFTPERYFKIASISDDENKFK